MDAETTMSNELKTARALQREIIGYGRYMAPCGCIGEVTAHFPKRSWIYIVLPIILCEGVTPAPALKCGWYDKDACRSVTDEEFATAWRQAKKSERGLVRVSRFYEVKEDVGSSLILIERHTIPVVDKEPAWPPKMIHAFLK